MGTEPILLTRDRCIGPGCPALIVAEIGQNHNGRLELAESLIDVAAWAGADAVKVVKRDVAAELRSDAAARPYETPHAFGSTYGAHRQALELSAADHARLAERIREHGLVYVATACDLPSVDLMLSLGVDAFKVASRDLTNLPLLARLAETGLPVLLSTGMATLAEIDAAVDLFDRRQVPLVVLQCTSLYPTPAEHAHLRSLATLAGRYRHLVGYSDHTLGGLLPPVAVALGAAVVEKHITLDCTLKGTDHRCSLEPEPLRQLVADVRRVERALGRGDKPLVPGVERVREKLGRSLVTRLDLPAGTLLDEAMLALKSPGDGLSWLDRSRVVGHRLRRDLAADHPVSVDDVD